MIVFRACTGIFIFGNKDQQLDNSHYMISGKASDVPHLGSWSPMLCALDYAYYIGHNLSSCQ